MRLLYLLPGHDPRDYQRRVSDLLTPLMRVDAQLEVRDIASGPSSLEYGYQEAVAMPELIDTIRNAEKEFDGVVIGCFLDPGIHIAREVTSIPIVGLGQSSLQLAATLGYKIGILAGLKRLVPAIERMVYGYGYDYFVETVEATGLTVSDMRTDRHRAATHVHELIQDLVAQHNVEVVVGGCGSLGEIFADLRAVTEIPLIDARVAAVKHLEMMVDLYRHGYAKTSKVGLYAAPPAAALESH